ncbi:hypothetical protein JXL83_03505 [candidate division WOR-3 bacterium]|nr:hypothetical protein [candidate division WOR-3 bacterium]
MRTYWLFIELENTLINEDKIYAYIYKRMWERASELGKTITFPRLLAMREALIREKRKGPPFNILGTRLLGKDNWDTLKQRINKEIRKNYMNHVRFFDDIVPQLKDIRMIKNLKITFIAFQPKSIEDLIAEKKIKNIYRQIKIFEKGWLEIPNPSFLITHFDKESIKPENVIILTSRTGDYVKGLSDWGAKVILYKPKTAYKGWSPTSDDATGNAYLDSIQRSDRMEIDEEKKDMKVAAITTEFSAVKELLARFVT